MGWKKASAVRVTYLSKEERQEFNRKTMKQARAAERKMKMKLQGREA